MVYFAENCRPLGLSAFVSFHANGRYETLSKGFAASPREQESKPQFQQLDWLHNGIKVNSLTRQRDVNCFKYWKKEKSALQVCALQSKYFALKAVKMN